MVVDELPFADRETRTRWTCTCGREFPGPYGPREHVEEAGSSHEVETA